MLGERPDVTDGDPPGKVWSSVTLIQLSSTVPEGFGPRNCPKPSLVARGQREEGSVRSADRERITWEFRPG
jgi:hypothetical protein